MMVAILNSAILDSASGICGIQTPCYLLSESLKNTLTLLWLWLKLTHSDSNSFILTQLDDIGHLEFCLLGFSFWPSWIQDILVFFLWELTHTCQDCSQPFCTEKNLTHTSLLTIWHKKLTHSFLTQLYDGGHLEFCHLGFIFDSSSE